MYSRYRTLILTCTYVIKRNKNTLIYYPGLSNWAHFWPDLQECVNSGTFKDKFSIYICLVSQLNMLTTTDIEKHKMCQMS